MALSSAKERRERTPKQYFTKLAVAAIDFGTTFSGYAYSFRSDFQKNPLQIFSFAWESDEISTVKTPTCVLFEKHGNFDSFGYEAESKYADLAEEQQHQDWRFFKHFKMMLMPKGTRRLKKKVKIKDDQGQEMFALDVFAASIKYLKDQLLRRVTDAVPNFRYTDIHWVLTVPAIWEDSAKQFMREAAIKAGIESEQLTLALEPEGAAVYCKEIAVKVEETTHGAALSAFRPGSKFLLLDLGGGTVDITIEEVTPDGTLSELHHPDGGPWGGTCVDKEFKEFLVHIFGKSVMKTILETCKSDELFLYRNFELLKKKIIRGSSEKRIVRIPASLVSCAQNTAVVKRNIEQSGYSGRVELRTKDKLAIDESILAVMFDTSSSNIVSHLKKLFSQPEIECINTLILVGGFAESSLIAKDVRDAFHDKEVIVPQDASLAVLKGAVLYGHNPKSITSRKMPFTYGISTAVPFDRTRHPEYKKTIKNGIEKCEDAFYKFFEAGQTVIPDQTRAVHSFNPAKLTDSVANIEIYRTKERRPVFVSDDGCIPVGIVELKLAKTFSGDQNLIEVTFLAGHTEMMVQAKQLGTNNRIAARFKFLK